MTSQFPQNIYLHFLDRELRRSVGAEWNEVAVFKALLVALCLAPGELVCSYSHLWESSEVLRNGINTIQSLVTAQLLRPASDYATAADFLDSRVRLYSHDVARYPFYFKDAVIRPLEVLTPSAITRTGATRILGAGLSEIADGGAFHIGKVPPSTRRLIELGLDKRRGRAITGTLFDSIAGKDEPSARAVRREISYEYTKHYLNETGSDIVTGLRGLAAYDICSVRRPLFEGSLLFTLFETVGIKLETRKEVITAIEQAAASKNSDDARRFLRLWSALIREVATPLLATGATWMDITGHLVARIRSDSGDVRRRTPIAFSLPRVVKALENIHGVARARLISNAQIDKEVRIAFVVATDSELRSFEAVITEMGLKLKPLKLPLLAAWALTGGKYGDCVLVRTEAGSKDPSAAMLVVNDVLLQLHPQYIIMPGIAFGLRKDKTHIGDLMIARWITDYETVRQGEKRVIPRGNKYIAGGELLSKARMLAKGRLDIHFGEVISGDKLVDDPVFREQLKKLFPEAIGGEMEGAGVAAACERNGSNWLIAKAICDWGMGKSDEHQSDAGVKAVKFCLDLVDMIA